MNGYFIGAALALVFAGAAAWKAKDTRTQRSRLLITETSTTALVRELAAAASAAAGAGSYAERVELEGVAVPGPRGLLTSELSATECLWHRHKVTRKYTEIDHDRDGNRRTRNKEQVVTDNQTKDPFLLRDEHGEIILIPTARVHGPRKAVSEFRPSGHRDSDRTGISLGSFSLSLPGSSNGETLGYEYEEWVLLPETRIFVAGEATDRGGELEVRGPKGEDKMLISTKSEDAILDAHADEAKKYALVAVLGVVGAIALVVLNFVLGDASSGR